METVTSRLISQKGNEAYVMQIDDDLILQWEPKIQKMLSGIFVVGMDRDDVAQELRIAIIKAARAYDEDRGVIFHTYLHTTLVNTIRTLISKAQRQLDTRSLDFTRDDSEFIPAEIANALIDPNDYIGQVETSEWLDSSALDEKERFFLKLKLEGLTMEEITEDLGESAYKVRQSLREKFSDLADEYEINY